MKGSTKVTAVVATALSAGILGSGVAFAGWFEGADSVTGKLTTAAMPGFDSRPGVQLTKNTVTVQWFAQKVAKKVPVQRYVVTRYDAGTGAHEQVCGANVTATRCKDTEVPAGTWEYTVRTVQYRWTGPESRHSDPVTIAGPAPAEVAPTVAPTFEAGPVTVSPTPGTDEVTSPATSSPITSPPATTVAPPPQPGPTTTASETQEPGPPTFGPDPDRGE